MSKGFSTHLITSGFSTTKFVFLSDLSSFFFEFWLFGFVGINEFVAVFQEFTEYTNLEESLEYIEECMIKHGPFDGLLGFSQVSIFSLYTS